MSGKEKSVEIQPELILNIHYGEARSTVLRCAVELGVFNHIHEGQGTVEKLCRIIGSSHRAMRIFLDALVGMGVLAKARGAYKLSPEAKEFLVKGESHYLGQFLTGTSVAQDGWKNLCEVVQKGEAIPEFADPEHRTQFFKELVKGIFPTSFSSGVILGKKLGMGKTLKDQKILDIGCGAAPWSIALALADPSAQVMGVDYPDIIDIAKAHVKRFHVSKQFDWRPGDFHKVKFEKGAYDLVMLGHILHGEGETSAKKLIKRAHDALKPGGKILIAEFLSNDLRTGPELPLLFALNMLLYTPNGDVFSAKELKRWMGIAGFKKTSALAVQFPATVMVGTK